MVNSIGDASSTCPGEERHKYKAYGKTLAEYNWSLKESLERTLTIEVRNLFQNFTTCTERLLSRAALTLKSSLKGASQVGVVFHLKEDSRNPPRALSPNAKLVPNDLLHPK